MTTEETNLLARELAIKTIVHELHEMMVPGKEALPRAIACLDNNDQQALTVQYYMFCALVELEHLGYRLVKDNG